jgi:hypothetical protein
MNRYKNKGFSRREFARRAAFLSASLLPTRALLESPAHAEALQQPPENAPKLSTEGQVEAEARYQQILSMYGSRFNAEDRATVRKLCFDLQPSLDRLRAFPLANGDIPALYLKPLVEREKKPSAAPGTKPAAAPAKKP